MIMNVKVLEKYPVIVGFVGVILGSLVVGFYQHKLYESQRFDKRIEKKEKLLGETYKVYAKMPEIQFWQTEVEVTASDSSIVNNWIYTLNKERNPIISQQFSDLLAINKMIELYFGNNIKNQIHESFNHQNNREWWNIPPKELNKITEAMADEIRIDIKRGY